MDLQLEVAKALEDRIKQHWLDGDAIDFDALAVVAIDLVRQSVPVTTATL